jgi:hypothetical protein
LTAKNRELIRPELAKAQKKLEVAMDEACDSDVKDADTAELVRIEESLGVARAAAKEAISVRERLRGEREQDQKARENHRRFDDATGKRWDAFAVYPSAATMGRAVALPDPYVRGWLSFDSGTETRRLAPIPDGWREMSEAALLRLWEKAEVAPRRKR